MIEFVENWNSIINIFLGAIKSRLFVIANEKNIEQNAAFLNEERNNEF